MGDSDRGRGLIWEGFLGTWCLRREGNTGIRNRDFQNFATRITVLFLRQGVRSTEREREKKYYNVGEAGSAIWVSQGLAFRL